MNVELENVGSSPAYNVSGVLSTANPHVLITDNTQAWGTINDGTTSTQNNAFAIVIANNIPDQTIVSFNLDITGDSDDIWNATFSITVNAPSLEFGNMTIDDGRWMEMAGSIRGKQLILLYLLRIMVTAIHSAASALLSSISSYITVNSGSASLGAIGAGGNADAVFNITCDPLTPIGTSVDLTVDVDAGEYHISNTFYQSVGLVLEDWETGTFYSFPWILQVALTGLLPQQILMKEHIVLSQV